MLAAPTTLSTLKRLLASALLTLLCGQVVALPEDAQKPIYISADSAVKDDRKGVTVYQGDVEITQGTMNIKADKVTIYIEAEKVSQIVAIGQPATFKQQPEPERGDVLAEGKTIDYLVTQKLITLTENASLTQDDGSQIKGNRIQYDINATRAEATSGGKSGKDRVNVVILPAPESP